MALPVPSDDQVRLLLQTVWDELASSDHWPTYGVVDRLLYQQYRLDVDELLRRTSEQLLLGGRGAGSAAPTAAQQLRLTIAGAALCKGTELVVQSFLLGVRLAAGVEDEHLGGADEPALTANQLIEGASDGGTRRATPEAARLARQVGLLLLYEPWTASSSLYEGGWRIGVSRRVRPYVDVADLDGYWTRRTETLRRTAAPRSNYGARPLPSLRMTPVRAIEELRELRDQAASPEVQRDDNEHEGWKAKVDVVMAVSLGHGSATLSKFRDLRYHFGVSTGAAGEADNNARYFASQVARASALIDAAIFELDLQSPNDSALPANLLAADASPDAPIFVVHGRDDGRKYELMRLLDRTTNRDAMVLHEQPNRGATILEKFERHAQAAGFAVVLLTGDDEGRLRGDTASLNRRGRQNVILELGVFLGRLRRSHVAVLIDPDVERPSDLDGLVYIPSSGWRLEALPAQRTRRRRDCCRPSAHPIAGPEPHRFNRGSVS